MSDTKHPAAAKDAHAKTLRDDAIAREFVSHGFIQLDPKLNPDVSLDELERIPRETRRDQMDHYFRAKIEIFEAEKNASAQFWLVKLLRRAAAGLPLLVCLGATFLAFVFFWIVQWSRPDFFLVLVSGAAALGACVIWVVRLSRKNDLVPASLWPGFFEERLSAFTERRFGTADHDMRELIARLIKLFLGNLWTFIKKKRRLQLNATAFVSAVPLAFGLLPLDQLGAVALLVVFAAAPVWFFATRRLFDYFNRELHKNYSMALEHSAREVSIKITQRMKSLSQLITQYITKLQELQQKGEKLPSGADAAQLEHLRDEQLRDGSGYFYIQTILFQAKRNEHLELYLWDEMHGSRRHHMMYDAGGLALCLSIFAFAAAFQTWVLAASLAPIVQGDFAHPIQALAGGLSALGALWLSYGFAAASYASPKWTSGAGILQDYFDTSDWDTYAKLQIDVKLASRFQRAIYWIRDLFELRRER